MDYRVSIIFEKTPKMRIFDVNAESPQDAIRNAIDEFNREKQKQSSSKLSEIKSIITLCNEMYSNVRVELLNADIKETYFFHVNFEQ